ncbi:MAG: Rieske 2Fe-2S domain-containing protein [Chloroflexi bacterium]|nr:Rieske 2Fe-2S domain-containing protein [Chloroflexota bacterium]
MSSKTSKRTRPEKGNEPRGTNLVCLGLESEFKGLPARVSIGWRSFYLVRNHSGYELLSTTCPHMGGEVTDTGACFECPNHGWQFDHDTGQCLNAPRARLASFPVVVQDGRLWSDVPMPGPSKVNIGFGMPEVEQLEIHLHAHACLEIRHKGFSLLTDPWLCGPAFLGSWIQYPPPVKDVAELRPDAIWISHEHPDHFHEPTLLMFDRATPIYTPDFPNRRIVTRLSDLGFTDVRPMAFGKTYAISNEIGVTCFEPAGMWNDALSLTEVGGFRILNMNDAGLNQRIASIVRPVHALAVQFSGGASSYPLAWSHISRPDKIRLLNRRREGMIAMLKQAVDIYGATHLLPFASDFALWHPSHREYAYMMRKITRDEVKMAFEGTEVKVIDLLPGDSWDVSTGDVNRWEGRQPYDDTRNEMLSYIEERFDEAVFSEHHPVSGSPTYEEMAEYFLRLNQSPEMAFCEELTVTVRATTIGDFAATGLEISFEVDDGRLRILKDAPAVPNLLMEVPSGVLKRVIDENLSWDEAHIGFWCRFTRSPDIYHAGFWRLIQSPYFRKPATPPPLSASSITSDSIMADMVESYGAQADRVLRRYGLYCAGCEHSTACSIAIGAREHGIDAMQVDKLVRELNQIFASQGESR